jgi:heptosyltransferase-2
VNTLIVKLNATGDVVRTTPLLRRLEGTVTWVTDARNVPLLDGVAGNLRCLDWKRRAEALDRRYDLVVSLEDDVDTAAFVDGVAASRIFGAYRSGESVVYTDDAREWFDLSLISRFGRERADALKLANRRSYQDLVFGGLGWRFAGEQYLLPPSPASDLRGDVAIAPVAGPVWPMKGWKYYGELQAALERVGLVVNVLPQRPTLLEHLADIRAHRSVVCGDSLPMHLAIGSGIPCTALFNCTSPWEIDDYGLLTKVVSPLISEFFYKRALDERAIRAVRLDDVLTAVLASLGKS